MRKLLRTWAFLGLLAAGASSARADWKVLPATDQRQPLPSSIPAQTMSVRPGDNWPQDAKFRWMISDIVIPDTIENALVAGHPIGLRFNCGDGGEIYVDGKLQSRYDNDHPALVILAEEAKPGTHTSVAVQVYGKVQGDNKFAEADLAIIEPQRARDRLIVEVSPGKTIGNVPSGIVGLSQGGGMSDYEDATAEKLKEGGFKWFRMDNVFTGALRNEKTDLIYDWSDFDRRVDFISKVGADPIFAVSYMPPTLDAVANSDGHSAPNNYILWEDLCYRAAKHSLERGHRIPCWEVWNEVNVGRLQPGPGDFGEQKFHDLYAQAIGTREPNHEVVRRFEAYCKLYKATAQGLLRADPKAKIGGPALASGPFENSKCDHCFHGKGFARGLMLWCDQERLPLDFISWHEYYRTPDTIVQEADAFRSYLSEFPKLQRRSNSLVLSEWNEAWWPDRPQDNEIGAAWAANTITRAFIPHEIDRPCFFYVKQGDMDFRGDYSLLMKDNAPKASFNVAKIFNHLSGKWVRVIGSDDDISAVAALDNDRLAIVLVNFAQKYSIKRKITLDVNSLPFHLRAGQWREWVVDATHSNIWNDPQKSELTMARSGSISKRHFQWNEELGANSVVLLEIVK